jgi:ADP-ribose pyrophosphatase YjhB (NUDIX family)
MELPSVQATVVLLMQSNGSVCLARKKQAIHHEDGEISYSLGLYNGYGGKKEMADVTIEDTAIRELFDESGVVAKKEDLKQILRVYFYIKKEERLIPFMDVSFFLLHIWERGPQEGNEMGEPIFFAQDSLPYDEMMPADKVLFEKVFRGEKGVYEIVLSDRNSPPNVSLLR